MYARVSWTSGDRVSAKNPKSLAVANAAGLGDVGGRVCGAGRAVRELHSPLSLNCSKTWRFNFSKRKGKKDWGRKAGGSQRRSTVTSLSFPGLPGSTEALGCRKHPLLLRIETWRLQEAKSLHIPPAHTLRQALL